MKYALSFFMLTILATFSQNVSARSITSFSDSFAIMTVSQFLYDAAEDLPVAPGISDKKIQIKDLSKCTVVNATHILSDVEASIQKVLRVYPDEEIPYEEALADLADYLDNQTFKKCYFSKKSSHSITESFYYVDGSDQIHLRMDNRSLTAE